jgi:hypothetical protein
MISRLRDHVERLDNGAVHAADDLAVVLRALLGNGTGNNVLRRLYEECGIARPEVILSRPPSTDSKVQFSVGSIPTFEAGAIADGAVRVPFNRWVNKTVLVVTLAAVQQKFTWAEFLNIYANKWGGAHLDVTVPTHFQFIDTYIAGGLSLTGYLLRTAAVQVWFLAQNAFRQVLRNSATDSLTAEELSQVRYTAEGGVNTDPRDISGKGQLQWFCHSSDRLGLLWYVNEDSNDNALRLMLGVVSYDVRYTPPSGPMSGQPTPLTFQAPRRRNTDEPVTVDRDKLKVLPLDSQIKTLSQVRAAARSEAEENTR